MKCLIKLYDNEQVNNLISILAFHPEKVIFLYDKRYVEVSELQSIENACIQCIANINFEFISIDTQNLDSIINRCKKVIHFNPKCYFDITGGEELSVIGAFLACKQSFIPVFKIDIDLGNFINVCGCTYLTESFKMPNLTLETILASKGALLKSCLHATPDENQFDSILSFCNLVLNNTHSWKDLCNYIQNSSKSSVLYNDLKFISSIIEPSSKISLTKRGELMLKYAQDIGLINNLKINQNDIEFVFANEKIKKYMSDFGSWIELYAYITIKQSNLFKNVKMSSRIGWDGNKGEHSRIINEIDITFFSGISPVFVSCKLSDPNTEALQELSMYPNYFGGKRSKCILITAGNVKTDKPSILDRAVEMGINIIDKNDLSKEKFLRKIESIVLH